MATPFGGPVEPDVNITNAGLFWSGMRPEQKVIALIFMTGVIKDVVDRTDRKTPGPTQDCAPKPAAKAECLALASTACARTVLQL